MTLNTDNRLMSGVSLSREFAAMSRTFGIGLDEMEWLTLNGMKSAFEPFDGRLRLITAVIKPGLPPPARRVMLWCGYQDGDEPDGGARAWTASGTRS